MLVDIVLLPLCLYASHQFFVFHIKLRRPQQVLLIESYGRLFSLGGCLPTRIYNVRTLLVSGKDCIIVGFKFVHLTGGICRLFRRLLISYVRISLLLLVRRLAHRVHKPACVGLQNGWRGILDEQIGWLR